MATYKALILQSKYDTKKDGTTNIKIRITHKRKTNYISTDLYIFPEQMNRETGKISGKHKNIVTLKISQWLNKCLEADHKLGSRRNLLSVAQLKKYILNEDLEQSPLEFFEVSNEIIQRTKNKNTAGQYISFLSSLRSFSDSFLFFSDINLNFLHRYENFLIQNGVKNGIRAYMATFRSLFNKARLIKNDEELKIIPIPHYPFKKYTMPKPISNTKNHLLTVSELKSFIEYKPISKGEIFAKDMFLLIFYLVGIEAIDLYNLGKPVDGRITYDRFKTGRLYSIKLEPEAKKIIDKYPSKTHLINVSSRYRTNNVFLRQLNSHLHGVEKRDIIGVAKHIGIEKNITTKWAKHTWATIARNDCRIHKSDVALCLGHSDPDNQVTDIYVKYDYTIIDDSNRKVIDFVNSHSTSLDVTLDNK